MTLDQAQRPIEVGAVALFVFFRPSRYVRRVDMIVPKFALDAICALTRAHAPRAQCLAIANVVDQAAFAGTVQGVFPLSQQSAVKVTVAKYRTTNGREIDGVGIEPDVVVPLTPSDPTDTQFEKALEIIKEK